MTRPILTVAICSHNPDPAVLRRLLDGLKAQTYPRDQWELLLIDNNSAPPIAGQADVSWHPAARVLTESRLGIIHARLRAVKESAGDDVLFLDDDTIPDPTYLEVGTRTLAENPVLGVLGGYGIAEFPCEVPAWMGEFRPFYLDFAYSPERQEPFQYARTHIMGPWIPPTAGMIVRKNILEHYAQVVAGDSLRGNLGRRGRGQSAMLQGGEDEDIALTAIDLGYASGITRSMTYTHVIPAWRMRPEYLVKMLYSSNYSTAQLLVRRGLKKPAAALPRGWNWRLKQFLLAYVYRDPARLCWVALQRGYRDGLAGVPGDPFFIQPSTD